MSDLLGFAIVAAIIICGLISVPLSIGMMRRMSLPKERSSLPTTDIIARLERMEQGMEAIATEVERISEGQRFTTKMLSSSTDEKERIARSTT